MSGVPLRTVLEDLPDGGSAYVDRDWLSTGAEPSTTSVLLHDPARGFRFAGGDWIDAAAGDPDDCAWACFEALALDAAAAIGGARPVLVEGDGLLARRIRHHLPGGAAASGAAPVVAVDTTARSEGLVAASSAVADLGTVLLVATPMEGTLPFDLYQDVHRRGLRIVGVPGPAASTAASGSPPPTALQAGDPVDGSPWFVLRA